MKKLQKILDFALHVLLPGQAEASTESQKENQMGRKKGRRKRRKEGRKTRRKEGRGEKDDGRKNVGCVGGSVVHRRRFGSFSRNIFCWQKCDGSPQ